MIDKRTPDPPVALRGTDLYLSGFFITPSNSVRFKSYIMACNSIFLISVLPFPGPSLASKAWS
jgi:hypothetical protein